MKQQLYLDVIKNIFQQTSDVIDSKMFRQVPVEHYWKVLLKGEQKYGRVILLEEVYNRFHPGYVKLTFVRFLNEPAMKVVGFQVIEEESFIFELLLQSILDFTMPQSRCMVYFRKKDKLLIRGFCNRYGN